MKYDKTIKAFEEYLSKGIETINNDDPGYNAFINSINKNLDKLINIKPEISIPSPLLFAIFKDKIQFEKKLQEVTTSYDEVLGLITHEFKNILTSIHGYNMLLEKHLAREKDKEPFNYLMDSDRLTRQLFDMTNSLLKMSLGEKGLLKPELKKPLP